MKTIKINPKETVWTSIEADVATIVVHFNDGSKEIMSLFDFITINKRKKNKVVQIDCYKNGEEIK